MFKNIPKKSQKNSFLEAPDAGRAARILLSLAYRGGDFSGWQSQAHGRGVQDVVEKALGIICGSPVRIHGAGRTDAGVHALGQCAHFDPPTGSRFAPAEWAALLNANLPPGVRVLYSEGVAPDFHARFHAAGKQYCYRLWTGEILSPFEEGRVWHVPGNFDSRKFRETMAIFQGEHDFASFCVALKRYRRPTVRTISDVAVREEGDLLEINIEGNGFMYRMVRCLVGAAVRVARGKHSIDDVRAALREPCLEFPRFAAPAEGLFLVRVMYGPEG